MSGTNPDLAILVFAKAPVAGAAKTRLIPLLGAEGAAELQGRLLRHALATARGAAPAQLELWCAPDTRHPALVTAAGDAGATLQVQCSGNLGERMAQAFTRSLAHARYAICIGTDCPALTVKHLDNAASALREGHDAVLSPAEDGGYTLIGLSRNEPRLFEGIAWSSDQVMAQTRERLRDCGLRWQELDTLWDVDRPEDWLRLQRSGLLDQHHEKPPA
jgi:rSAM/selenodomain-associated transferase 1